MDVAAEFAALVAKAASEKSSPPPPVIPQTAPSSYVESSQVVTTNGPDSSDTNSIPARECMSPGSILTPGEALPVSKQQIVDVEESSNITHVAHSTISPVTGTPPAWKQGPLPHLTSVSLSSKPSGSNSKSDISNQAVSDEKVGRAKLEVEQQVVDFVPSVSAAELKISQAPVAVVKDLESTPVVSAQTNAATVEVVRSNLEAFPALKPNQSPRQKQPQRPEGASIVPQATAVAPTSYVQSTLPPVVAASRDTSAAETKVSKKPSSTEELTPTSSPFPVPQPPKEKRDQDKTHGRDREKPSVTSQGRGDREKLAASSSSSSSSSQHHGRDREKSSRDKEKASTAPQGVPKDGDKSASLGRDRDKSSTKEAITSPSPIVPVTPAVAPAASQPQPEQPPSAKSAGTSEETQQQTNGEVAAADVTEGEYMFIVKICMWKGFGNSIM